MCNVTSDSKPKKKKPPPKNAVHAERNEWVKYIGLQATNASRTISSEPFCISRSHGHSAIFPHTEIMSLYICVFAIMISNSMDLLTPRCECSLALGRLVSSCRQKWFGLQFRSVSCIAEFSRGDVHGTQISSLSNACCTFKTQNSPWTKWLIQSMS